MSDPLVEQFQTLISGNPTDVQWASLASNLPNDAFDRLKGFLTRDLEVLPSLRMMAGFLIMTRDNSQFRAEMAMYAITSISPNDISTTRRIVLRSLVEACAASPGNTDALLFMAFALHRPYREQNPIPNQAELGHDIRSCLQSQLDLFLQQPARVFVPPFAYAAARARSPTPEQLAGWPDADRADFLDKDRKFRTVILDKFNEESSSTSSGTVQSLTWADRSQEPTTAQKFVLLLLQQALLDAYNDPTLSGDIHRSTGDTILRHLEQCCRIWSNAFSSWNSSPDRGTQFSKDEAFLAETQLFGMIENLRNRAHPIDGEMGYFDSAAVDAYVQWLELCGGWSEPDRMRLIASTPAPLPCWFRDWDQAERNSRPDLNLIEAIAPHAFICYEQRLLAPQPQGEPIAVAFQNLGSVEYLASMVEELGQIALAQGLMPDPPILVANAPAAPLPSTPDLFLLPRKTHSRDVKNAPLHPDQRRAINWTLGTFYAWRADIEYRNLGPKPLGERLQLQEVDQARRFYATALALFEVSGVSSSDITCKPWIVGLGLLGRMLEIERETSVRECQVRIQRLDQGQDYVGDLVDWPKTFAWAIFDQIDQLLKTVDLFADVSDLHYQKDQLEVEVRSRQAARDQAQDLAEAAADYAAAEQATLSAAQIARDRQRVRSAVATLRRNAAQWHVDALKFATAAQQDRAQAEQQLLAAEEFQADQLKQQIKSLKDNIDLLEPQIKRLKDDIGSSQIQLNNFVSTAKSQHQRKQAERGLFNILKSVGSLVSEYFTGVDLVSIADTAYEAYKAADSGDWMSAANLAEQAADKLTNGKFSQIAGQAVDAAANYVGNLMADSFGDALTAVARATGLSPDKALAQTTAALSRQAVRIGVSYLAEQSHLEQLATSLGLQPSSQQIAQLRSAIEQDARTAVINAINRQGIRVVQAAENILGLVAGTAGTDPNKLIDAVGASAQTSGQPIETAVVTLIAKIRTDFPNAGADIDALKNSLLEARDQIVRKAAAISGAEVAKVQTAIDSLVSAGIDTRFLPPSPMPPEIRKKLEDFSDRIREARGRLGFLTTPGGPDQLASELADVDSDSEFDTKLDKISGQLSDGINVATDDMVKSQDELASLRQDLDQLVIDQALEHFKQNAEKFKSDAEAQLTQYQAGLGEEASESLLAAEQQIKIEELGEKMSDAQVEAQQRVVDGRAAESKAADSALMIAEFALARANSQLALWLLRNQAPGSDQRGALEKARAYFLDQANRNLVQAWQLINVYEFKSDQMPGGDQLRPKYNFPGATDIRTTLKTLQGAEDIWNTSLSEQFNLIASISPNEIQNAPPDLKMELMGFAGTYHPASPLHLSGPPDLARLKRGFTFRIAPRPRLYPTNVSANVTSLYERLTAAGGYVDLDRIQPWNTERTYRLRLIGVLLNITSGVQSGQTPYLYLSQEADGWIIVKDPDGSQRGVPLQLPRLTNNDGLGLKLQSGSLNVRSFDTRPLFATYTLKIDESDDLIDPDNFVCDLHFIAIGL